MERGGLNNNFSYFLKHKLYFILSPLICILLAIVYLCITTVSYTIGIKINNNTDNDLSAQTYQSLTNKNGTTEIRSKAFIGKVIAQLPLNVSYFETGSPRQNEIYGSEVPVQFKFYGTAYSETDVDLTVRLINNNQFSLTDQDSTVTYSYGQQIVKSYGAFVITRRQSALTDMKEIHIKSNNLNSLTGQYFKNFIIEPAPTGNYITLLIGPTSRENGVLFLKKILSTYLETDHSRTGYAHELNKIDDSLQMLSSKSSKINRHEDQSVSALADKGSSQPYTSAYFDSLNLRLKVRQALLPYSKSSTEQFIQIPDSYNINDKNLQALINAYNDAQLAKQHIINEQNPDNSRVTAVKSQVDSLQNALLKLLSYQINELKVSLANKPAEHQKTASADLIVKQYATLMQRKSMLTAKPDAFINSLSITSHKDEIPTTTFIITAGLLGLLLAGLLLYIQKSFYGNQQKQEDFIDINF